MVILCLKISTAVTFSTFSKWTPEKLSSKKLKRKKTLRPQHPPPPAPAASARLGRN